jgi:hypothetical protein
VLEVDPRAGRNTVYAARDRTRPLWSVPGRLDTGVRKILLSDDGSVVALVGGGTSVAGRGSSARGVRLLARDASTIFHRMQSGGGELLFEAATVGCEPAPGPWFDHVIDHGDRFVVWMPDGTKHTFPYTTSRWAGRWRKPVALAAAGLALILLYLSLRRPTPAPAAATEVETPAAEAP